MRKRRTKRKYTWLPVLGDLGASEAVDSTIVRIGNTTLTSPTAGQLGDPSDVVITAIVPDAPNEEPVNAGAHLSDFMLNEWVLKRIVGKFTVGAPVSQGPSISTVNRNEAYIFAAGFFVARADFGGGVSDQPIGAATVADRQENYGPLNLVNVREPWIWRRTWHLKVPMVETLVAASSKEADLLCLRDGGMFPYSNCLYGSVLDGPHIDARTGRRLGQDDRLWFATQCQTISTLGISGTAHTIQIASTLDVRILGAMRKARNRSAF